MILFGKEKELIFKITNAILLIWVVGALVVTLSSVIQLVVKEPTYTYEEYKASNCSNFKGDTSLNDAEMEDNCVSSYTSYKAELKRSDYYRWVAFYTAIGNVAIVGGVLYFINRKNGVSK